MISLSLISAPTIPEQNLDEFREYASIPGHGHDVMLRDLLLRAALVVQEYADKSVLPCTFRLDVTEYGGGKIFLYQSPAKVLSVTGSDGSPLAWTLSGKSLSVERTSSDVSVVYRTEPVPGEAQRLMPVVLRYATALYDGQDGSELDKIITEVC